MTTKKIEYERLEYIHCVLQTAEEHCGHCNTFNEQHMIVTAMGFVEDLREKFFDKNGELIDEVRS